MEIKRAFDFETAVNDAVFHIWSRVSPLHTEQKNDDLMMHMHYYCELQYVYEGEMEIILPDKQESITLRAGDFCLIGPHVYHRVRIPAEVHRCCLFLDVEYTAPRRESAISDYAMFSQVLCKRSDVTVHRNPLFDPSMRQFAELLRKEDARLWPQCSFLLLQAVTTAVKDECLQSKAVTADRSTARSNQLAYQRKRLIEEFIASSYPDPDGLSQLARQLFLSERQTHTVVKSLMGEDFKTLIVRQRILAAHGLMRTTDLTLDEISRRVGYRAYSGFYTAYLEVMGTTPEKMRQRLRDEAEA